MHLVLQQLKEMAHTEAEEIFFFLASYVNDRSSLLFPEFNISIPRV